MNKEEIQDIMRGLLDDVFTADTSQSEAEAVSALAKQYEKTLETFSEKDRLYAMGWFDGHGYAVENFFNTQNEPEPEDDIEDVPDNDILEFINEVSEIRKSQ